MTSEPQEILETKRLRLRAARRGDAAAIDTCVFSHPQVVSMLAHDGSTLERRMTSATRWSTYGADETNAGWARFGLGLFLIFAKDAVLAAPERALGVIGIVCGENEGEGTWSGELFYALDPAFHRRGLMSEAGAALMERAVRTELDEVYAIYWRMFNPVSGRLLRKLALLEDRMCGMRDQFADSKLAAIRSHELWRIETVSPEALDGAARIAGLRIGHLVGEGFLDRDAAVADTRAALAARGDPSATTSRATAVLDEALSLGEREPAAWRLALRRGPSGFA